MKEKKNKVKIKAELQQCELKQQRCNMKVATTGVATM
jgi:hypothetical protein